jgi:hypothetical protein
MDNYYDALTAHRIKLDIVYNELADIWGKNKRPKVIRLADENDYTTGYPVIYNREKYYVIALELKKDEVLIHLQNHNTDMFIADEICWYGNHDLKTLVINEVSKHLGYLIGEVENDNTNNKKKEK